MAETSHFRPKMAVSAEILVTAEQSFVSNFQFGKVFNNAHGEGLIYQFKVMPHNVREDE